MSTRLFSSLERKLSPNVPGCPLPVMIQYVRDAAIEVCKKTLVYRFEQEAYELTDGVYEYPYELPRDTEVVAVFSASINGITAQFVTLEQLTAYYPDWPSEDEDDWGSPRVFSEILPTRFVVAPVPDDEDTYTAKMFLALKPTLDADGMDEEVFDHIEQAVIHGALYRLFSLPERSWSNGDLAEYHNRQYVYVCNQHRAQANLGTGRAPLAVRMVSFGA